MQNYIILLQASKRKRDLSKAVGALQRAAV